MKHARFCYKSDTISPIRVLMVTAKYPYPVVGGLERQAHELARTLARHGHAVHVVSTSFHSKQPDFDLADGIQIHRIKWFEVRLWRFLILPFSLMRILLQLRRDVDLVHLHSVSWFSLFTLLFVKIIGMPVLSKLPSIGKHGLLGIQESPLGFLKIALLKKSDAIVAMTPENAAELLGIGYPPVRILKVMNGISPLPETTMNSRRPLSNGIIAIFVGRLSREKGLPDLLHAWVFVKAHTSCSVNLRIVGEGPQEDELKSLAQALNLGESVKFCGFCRDVQTELAQADLFVLPSPLEGNSNAILEAMRAGLPIIATRVGGAPIQVGDEGKRFLIPPGNPQALANRLLELIENKELRLGLGAAMRKRVETIFSIDQVALVYEQAYRLLIAGNSQKIGGLNSSLFH